MRKFIYFLVAQLLLVLPAVSQDAGPRWEVGIGGGFYYGSSAAAACSAANLILGSKINENTYECKDKVLNALSSYANFKCGIGEGYTQLTGAYRLGSAICNEGCAMAVTDVDYGSIGVGDDEPPIYFTFVEGVFSGSFCDANSFPPLAPCDDCVGGQEPGGGGEEEGEGTGSSEGSGSGGSEGAGSGEGSSSGGSEGNNNNGGETGGSNNGNSGNNGNAGTGEGGGSGGQGSGTGSGGNTGGGSGGLPCNPQLDPTCSQAGNNGNGGEGQGGGENSGEQSGGQTSGGEGAGSGQSGNQSGNTNGGSGGVNGSGANDGQGHQPCDARVEGCGAGGGGGGGGQTGSGSNDGDDDGDGEGIGPGGLPGGDCQGDDCGLYTKKYPDGVKGEFEKFKGQFENTDLAQLAGQLMPSWNSGTNPSWELNLNFGGHLNMGTYTLEVPEWIWPPLRAIVIVMALIFARRAIFGG